MNKTFRVALTATLPVMAGYLVLGMAFGLLMTNKGFAAGWAVLMSVFVYAGSMQFVGAGLLAGGASLASAALMTLLVNARHLCYGLSMLRPYRDAGAMKPYLIFALTDETYSLVCSPSLPPEVDSRWYYFWVSLLDQCYWVAGTAAGCFLGSALPFDTTGVDFAMTALFLVIFLEQWEKAKSHLPALLGLGAAGVCLLVFGPSSFLIPAMVCIVAGLLALRPLLTKGGSQ